MDYVARAKNWITDSDVKQKLLAQDFHVSEAAFSNYLTGRSEMPIDILVKIARYYNISMDYLVGLSDEPRPSMVLSESEQAMVSQFRQLNPDQRDLILNSIRFMLKQNQK